ncbi:MAG: phosphatase PAP2 family protein [Candidatus Limnocylindria bacterium]
MAASRSVRDAVAVAGALTFLLLATLVALGATDAFDFAVTSWLTDPERSGGVPLARAVTDLGSTWAVTLIAVALLAVLLARRAVGLGLLASGTIAVVALGNSTIKLILSRARPEVLNAPIVEPGFSFPSGHALMSATTYGVLAVLVLRGRLPRPVKTAVVIALAALVGCVGLTRVYLGVHFLTDVIAGWVLGAVIVLVFARSTDTRAATADRPPALAVDPAAPVPPEG